MQFGLRKNQATFYVFVRFPQKLSHSLSSFYLLVSLLDFPKMDNNILFFGDVNYN
jgi:hypothetical protein